MNHVDNTQEPLPIIGACYGYGGLELGVRAAVPLRAVAYVEREAYACANLVAAIEAGAVDAAPICTDLREFPWELYRGRVAGLLAGYPCQPDSAAGARLGKADARWLWPYLRHGIDVVRPSWCFFENVAGHVSRGLADVLQDLGRLGYIYTACLVTAAERGAPHLRKRIFILAADPNGPWKHQLQGVIAEQRRRVADSAREVAAADANGERRRQGRAASEVRSGESQLGGVCAPTVDADGAGPRQRTWGVGPRPTPFDGTARGVWWTTESPLCSGDDAGPARIDQLRLCGNGVVPASAEEGFRLCVGELAGISVNP